MKLYGEKILITLNEICSSCDKSIWLEFGTLLGAYREHNFIRHDYDMDLGMYFDEYDDDFEACLINNGFKKIHHFIQCRLGNRFLTEVTWEYEGFHVDIFLCIREELPEAYPLEVVYINNVICKAPAHVIECLKKYYGDGFMIPDKGSSATDKTDRVNVWDIDCAFAEIVIDN